MILLDQKFKILTDHKNVACKNFNNDGFLWWKLTIE